jgi:hypothetical protein
MTRLAGLLAVLVLAAPAAEAARRPKLPKPIDSPIVRPKLKTDHKAGKVAGNHPQRLMWSDYGNEWGRILNVRQAKPLPYWMVRQD